MASLGSSWQAVRELRSLRHQRTWAPGSVSPAPPLLLPRTPKLKFPGQILLLAGRRAVLGLESERPLPALAVQSARDLLRGSKMKAAADPRVQFRLSKLSVPDIEASSTGKTWTRASSNFTASCRWTTCRQSLSMVSFPMNAPQS